MSNDKPKNDSITIQNTSVEFDIIAGLNSEKDDYNLLKNKPVIQTYTLPNASTSVLGGVKLATAPASPTNPVVVGDNDPRLVKNFAKGQVSISSGTATTTVTVGFTPSIVRITAVAGSNMAVIWNSVSNSSGTSGNGFDYQSGFGTTACANGNAVYLIRSGTKVIGTISIITNQFTLSFDWNQFDCYVLWEAHA